MKQPKITLPPCGTLIGAPVYLFRGDYIFQSSGKFYTSWISEDHDAAWYIDRAVKDNQGNMVAIWDGGATEQSLKAMADYMALDELGVPIPEPDWARKRFLTPKDWGLIAKHPERLGAGLVRMVRQAAQRGLYSFVIYADADPRQLKRLKPCRNWFLGCNVGEVFTFRLEDDPNPAADGKVEPDLRVLADNFTRNVRACVRERVTAGWGHVMATGGIATVDYEVIGGITMPVVEDFAVQHLNAASALARGLYKQFKLPLWGTDIAHEHYSWLPYASRFKFPMLTHALRLKYMSGCKLLLLESGNYWQQSDHVEDTPMHQVPKLDLGSIKNTDPHLSAPYVRQARKHYPNINASSPICRRYRKILSDFYDFVKKHGTPAGQPEVRIAAIKGNLDLSSQAFNPNSAIAGMYAFAEKDPRWFESAPERSRVIFDRVFHPRHNVLGEYQNPFFSGTPYGMTDTISFAGKLDVNFLSRNYRALLFTGWNTASVEQYEALVRYVRRGGTLFLSIPHLSTNRTRNYLDYGVRELVNGGDFSELCGVRITGRSGRFYWAVTPGRKNALGISPYRKFGVYLARRGDAQLCGSPEVLAVEDERFQPVLFRNRVGKGVVYFLNTWDYPGALEPDNGPGATRHSIGLIGEVYRRIALDTRGSVYITDDGHAPGRECDHVVYSYFPSNKKVYLLNADFTASHAVLLHRGGKARRIRLRPQQFLVV